MCPGLVGGSLGECGAPPLLGPPRLPRAIGTTECGVQLPRVLLNVERVDFLHDRALLLALLPQVAEHSILSLNRTVKSLEEYFLGHRQLLDLVLARLEQIHVVHLPLLLDLQRLDLAIDFARLITSQCHFDLLFFVLRLSPDLLLQQVLSYQLVPLVLIELFGESDFLGGVILLMDVAQVGIVPPPDVLIVQDFDPQ